MSVDITNTVEKARQAFATGRTKTMKWRKEQLLALRRMVLENDAAMHDAVNSDLHKHAVESSLVETGMAVKEIDDTLARMGSWAKPKSVNTDPFNLPARSEIVPEPYGVALIVGCWNYPVQMALLPLIPAIAAGNAVVIKTGSEDHSPATAKLLCEIIPKYLDKEAIAIIGGDCNTLAEVLKLKFDIIMATGSPGLGRMVMAAAAVHLTPVLLELGGKSPAYIHKSADIAVSARRVAWGSFMNAGQTCIRPDHIFVDKEIADEFIDAFTRETKAMYSDNPEASEFYGRVANLQSLKRLEGIVAKDRKYLVWGGGSNDDDFYLAPTLLDFKDNSAAFHASAAMENEIFGPIAPILRVDNTDEVIKSILSRPKPLALYVFTSDKRQRERFINETSSGALVFNDVVVYATNNDLPFGGVGNSGIGSYHGKFGFDAFSHQKPVMSRPFALDVPARYPPYTPNKAWLLSFASTSMSDGLISFLNIMLAPATWALTAVAGSAAVLYSRARAA